MPWLPHLGPFWVLFFFFSSFFDIFDVLMEFFGLKRSYNTSLLPKHTPWVNLSNELPVATSAQSWRVVGGLAVRAVQCLVQPSRSCGGTRAEIAAIHFLISRQVTDLRSAYSATYPSFFNKPIQDGGNVDAPLWLNRLREAFKYENMKTSIFAPNPPLQRWKLS